MKDPILLAEAIKQNYALHFFGEYKAKFDTLLDRFQLLTPGIPKLDEFLKMRGPYVQALSIPRWSDATWRDFAARVRGAFAPAGLHPVVVEGLADAGIQRLHTFQEQAVARIADDKNTLVVAGTGRGKSESWLIPLFQFIAQEKLAGHVRGTKAVLIYPTKALAQDQFRRIIAYLLHINKRLAGTPITVGIYDGDTPYQSDRNLESFLSKSFRFMDCPKKGSKPLCDVCINTAVQVENLNSHVRLTVAERECQSEVSLDFIHLTREDVLKAEVDILITNPDTINFQLINVNNPTTRKVFIEQPRFIVLDEVHIYNGLFGAFVAMLMRRLRQVRGSLGVSQPLRFVASSATVQNKEEIFERLCDVHDPAAVIAEQNAVLPSLPPSVLPAVLTGTVLEEERLLKVWQGESDAVYEQALRDLGLSRPGAASPLPPRVTLGEQLLNKLTRQPEPRLAFMVDIYGHMRAEPQSPRQILEGLVARWGITRQAAENVLANFTLLGGLAGILERRAHLFAWALDGYYGCAACGKVYASPVGQCDCSNPFVTRLAFCTHCGEEVLEVWACPTCLHVYPMVASRDGESLFYDPPVCSCGGHGQGTVTTRALIHPDRECHQCGTVSSSSQAITCPECDAWTTPQGERMVCTNPDCSWHGPLPSHACPSCGETPGALLGYAGQRCERCGTLTPEGSCCGQAGMPALSVPWV
ncbi:MAG TPA: DEAD/DEAH box helicase, partial [Symbiobacteriaceae bacterium]|nr:DEAD/DEAH box helicase [Symbiobacteriaceae bacterium]